jgi:hypothetical protein
MEVINLTTGLFLIGIGFLVKAAPNLIAGYNSMSEEQKKNVDIEGLSTFMRNGLIIIGLVIILGYYFFEWLGFQGIAESMILVAVLGGVAITVFKAQKFDHNKTPQAAAKNPKLIFGIAGITLVTVFGLIYYGTVTPKVIFNENTFEITGMYGVEKNYEEVTNVELMATIPKILLKTNGFDFNQTRKGFFKLETYGKCRLFLKSKQGPFVIINDTEEKRIILNLGNSTETEQVFNDLKRRLPG